VIKLSQVGHIARRRVVYVYVWNVRNKFCSILCVC